MPQSSRCRPGDGVVADCGAAGAEQPGHGSGPGSIGAFGRHGQGMTNLTGVEVVGEEGCSAVASGGFCEGECGSMVT